MWARYRTPIVLAVTAAGVKALSWIFDQAQAQFASDLYAFLLAIPYVGPGVASVSSWVVLNSSSLVFFGLFTVVAYTLGKIASTPEPDFVVEKISTDKPIHPDQLFLTVRNLGEPFDSHIVKLTNLRRVRDGSTFGSDGDYPQTMRTVARQNDQLSSRFLLSANEPKQVMFCRCAYGSPVVQCEASDHVLVENEHQGYIATVELFGRTSSKYEIWVGMSDGDISARILAPQEFMKIESFWSKKRPPNAIVVDEDV